MGIFVNATDEISVSLAIGYVGNKMVVEPSKEELKEANIDIDESKIEEHTVWFKVPNYAESAIISSHAMSISGAGINFDPTALKIKRFFTLAKRWTFKDNDKKDIPVNEKTISELQPTIASVINDALDKLIGLS